jgi:chromate transporter
MDSAAWLLLLVFAPLSLVAVGGGGSVLPDIQRQAVDIHHWLSARDFVDYFAISRAAPGPGSMLVTLIGWRVDGWVGALAATAALMVPSSILAYGVARVWHRYRGRDWHTALERGLAPIGTGLILSAALTVFQIAHGGAITWIVGIGSAILLGLAPRLHPLLLLAAGGAIFALPQLWA